MLIYLVTRGGTTTAGGGGWGGVADRLTPAEHGHAKTRCVIHPVILQKPQLKFNCTKTVSKKMSM